jgi:hypothetical protein
LNAGEGGEGGEGSEFYILHSEFFILHSSFSILARKEVKRVTTGYRY